MSKKITVTLSEKAESYFNELMYSLTGKDDKPATQSECINESLETLADFEKLTDNQLRGWNDDFAKIKTSEAQRNKEDMEGFIKWFVQSEHYGTETISPSALYEEYILKTQQPL